ncbi:MAG TPA: cytochrome b/b6 domain-containing protein [Steroidobacteraceae bacterium]|nr:cytochrome b/b6 domain-containing protein [Steroidobacteraceae bacterium]
MTEIAKVRVRVWDGPTRIAHWSMVGLFGLSWWTAETGRLEWHRWSGYVFLGVLLFRVCWGFFGSSTARFAQFLKGPREVVAYVRGRWALAPGHNPLGALSVLVLLLLLLAQVALGLFAVDVDGIESGPLSTHVSFETGRVAAHWHGVVFNTLQVFIGLHIAAVLFYVFVKKENLVGAMLGGKRAYDSQPAEPVRFASWVRLIVAVVIAAAIAWVVSRE